MHKGIALNTFIMLIWDTRGNLDKISRETKKQNYV